MARSMWILFTAFFISVSAYNRQRAFVQVLVNRSHDIGLLTSSLMRSERGLRKTVQVRFSLLQPTNDVVSLLNTQVPFLKNSLCWAEKNLAATLMANHAFGHPPEYVVYTDNHTHSHAQGVFQDFPWHRYQLINLDTDPRDPIRMAPFNKSEFDDKNLASVRRTLADSDHLSVSSGRLLLGTDIKFLQKPDDFTEAAASLKEHEAIYMIDRFWQGETADGQPVSDVLYRMNHSGPQCPGLLGDFVYLSPGTEVSMRNLQSKMLWYMNQPRLLTRTIPPCPASCMASNGLHAIDQFALVMALGEAVRPAGQGCFPLDAEKYSHWYPRTTKTQVTHDKTMDACMLKSPQEDWSSDEDEDKLRMLFAVILLLLIAVTSLFCAFLEEKGDPGDWKGMCSS
ncbi:unnamed protein product [Effrenium voratum]|nr:unnamed protein product [Effrenium voratum]CAJ1415604.1 unnamed protein product [Effrenium voratum]|eukprot:CAMPEP_0181433610 /NCGR_PEP_ID=MMETSP1110-20121109/19384_1 /TAXON_ID=174948 /ORGANISM="Symbiodinium sp., Strain CCMP421" /LENGTH=395 /DNA_ID=CAMNT_0023557075 /DNA_START=156 /DNA_END=1343 /DNA_ORIENTATION=-